MKEKLKKLERAEDAISFVAMTVVFLAGVAKLMIKREKAALKEAMKPVRR